MHRLFQTCFVVIFVLLAHTGQAADVTLYSGKVFSGEIRNYTDDELWIITERGRYNVPYKMVESIQITELMDEVLTTVSQRIEAAKNKKMKRRQTRGTVESKNKNTNSNQSARASKNKKNYVKRSVRKFSRGVELYVTTWCGYCKKNESVS